MKAKEITALTTAEMLDKEKSCSTCASNRRLANWKTPLA